MRRSIIEALEIRRLLAISPAGAEFSVNTFTLLSQAASAVAMDADGDFVVVWQSFGQDGDGYGIFAQRYNASGVAQGNEFRVNQFTTATQANPAVAMSTTGDFVVAWRSAGQDGDGDAVMARLFSAAGAPLGAEFVVNTFTPGNQSLPAVAMDDPGNFVIAWQSEGQDGSALGVFARRYSAAGAPLSGEFAINTATILSQGEPAVAMDADGDFVIAWQSDGQDGSGLGIYAQRYNAAGVAQGGEFAVNVQTIGTQANPSVGMDALGNFVIVWEGDNADGAGRGVVLQRYEAGGAPTGPQSLVNLFTTSAQRNAAVAMSDDGQFVVTWQSDGQDGSGHGVFARYFDSTGLASNSETAVNTFTTGGQTRPAIAMDADGDCVITWESDGQDGSASGVFARRFSAVPAVVESQFLFETAPQRLRFRFDQNVSASLTLDDVVIQALPAGPVITPAGLTYDQTSNTATITFAGILPDANLRATLLSAGIANPAGAPMVADHVYNFFFLSGDANRDAQVNLQDFNALAANFGQSPRSFSQGDFNYDTLVNLADFNILAARFGRVLSAAAFGRSLADVFFDHEYQRDEFALLAEL